MAKISVAVRNEKRIRRAELARKKRLILKEIIRKGEPAEQETAQLKSNKSCRNDRCRACGNWYNKAPRKSWTKPRDNS